MCDERRSCRVRVVVLLLSLTLVPHRITQALTLGPTPKDAPVEWVSTQIGGNILCLGISWGGPLPSDSGTVFSDCFRLDFSGVCRANGGPGGSGVFPAKRGEAHWAGAFFTDAFTNFSLAAGMPHGWFRLNAGIAYPVVRALIYDRDGMIRSVDHDQGGGPAPIYAADGIQPGKQPALWLPFDWGQLRPVSEPALELTEKPYLKDPTRPEADNLDSIFLWRDEMTVLSGDGKLSDANGWWTAWFGRGDVLLTRLRPNAFTLPGYVPPADALSDSPPVEIDASDMNYWIETVMAGYPDLYEPLKLTYSPPLGHRVRNDPDNDRRAQVWLSPDYEPQRAPYTLIGQAYSFPLVTGALHTVHGDICVCTEPGCRQSDTGCLPKPQSVDEHHQGTPPIYLIDATHPETTEWLDLSITWWGKLTREEQYAQSGKESPHPKGLLTSYAPKKLETLVEWQARHVKTGMILSPDLFLFGSPDNLHAKLHLTTVPPGLYELEVAMKGEEGDRLVIDKIQVWIITSDLDIIVRKVDYETGERENFELDEQKENVPGAVVMVNFDDNDKDGRGLVHGEADVTSDKDDVNGVPGENDVLELKIHQLADVPPNTSFAFVLDFDDAPDAHLAIWRSPDKTGKVLSYRRHPEEDVTRFEVSHDTSVYVEGRFPHGDREGELITLHLLANGQLDEGIPRDSVRVIVPESLFVNFGIGPIVPGLSNLEDYLRSEDTGGQLWDIQRAPIFGEKRHALIWIVPGRQPVSYTPVYYSVAVCSQIKQCEQWFKIALQSDPESVVVYSGHSNYGLGPAFSDSLPPNHSDMTHVAAFMNAGRDAYPDDPAKGGFAGIDWNELTSGGGIQGGDYPSFTTIEPDRIHAEVKNYRVKFLDIERFPGGYDPISLPYTAIGPEEFFHLRSGWPCQGSYQDLCHYHAGSERVLLVDTGSDDVPEKLQYQALFMESCHSGRHFIETFQQGRYFYSTNLTTSGTQTRDFVQMAIDGKNWDVINNILNAEQRKNRQKDLYKYYVFPQ